MRRLRVVLAGCGGISDAWLRQAASRDDLEIVGLVDLNEAAATEKNTRYGLDAMAYARVATGDIDLVAETNLKPHDYDALVAVVRGAGGFVGNWSGGSDLTGGDVIAAASEALYEEAVKLL